MTAHLPVSVALEGLGWHPEAWRHSPAGASVLDGGYWAGLAATAERGLLDFVTFDDGLTPQRRRRPEVDPRWLAGRPDAFLVAARVVTATTHLGLVPVATVTHTPAPEIAAAVAALDELSGGRSGWQPRISTTAYEAALFGRPPSTGDPFTPASDVVAEVRAECPRPVVAALAHNRRVYEFASHAADLVFVTPRDDGAVSTILGEVADSGGGVRVYADVFVSSTHVLDERSDAYVFDGDAAELVDLMLRWNRLGVDGFRLRPSVNVVDVPFIVDEVTPLLRSAGRFRSNYSESQTLRQRLVHQGAP
ncbi:LLM class flavin-dependent oxidoreductase [Mycolicibacterium sediminis]|uniref:FMNH2-utilizing oxygenase n=1 Tax=Mycolicibacterium sediminis TaxID=1286180 RepID=A0A7I7QP07_9MYCO|nr:LLM class flavin-dependent oxidoreductase [Mycolicibacterium sediminis]BBY27770.1 FMNH2-utilizing oxygenase [Mycolicibacterium sediminis]